MPRAWIALIGMVVVACEEPRGELREWQPSDHQQPSADAPADGRAAPTEADPDPEATERRAATALFRAMCGSCHGEEGRGDGPGRPPAAPVSDLTSPTWQDARTDAEIAEAITLGRGAFMPAFGDQLSAPGIAALVRHVRRLGGRDAAAGGEAATGTEAEAGPAAPQPEPGESGAAAP